MRTLLFVLVAFSFIYSSAYAQDKLACKSESIPVKASGFLGFGKAAEEVKQIASLQPDQSGINDKALDVGDYRFVRKEGQWEILKKFRGQGFVRQNFSFPIKVFADQPIYVSQRGDDTLEIRRNTDDVHSTQMTIKFLANKEVEVFNKERKKLYTVSACEKKIPSASRNDQGRGGSAPAPINNSGAK